MVFGEEPQVAMTAEEFRLLAELIQAHCGILFKPDARFILERRLRPRLKAAEVADFAGYYRFLRHSPRREDELESVVEALTTHETYFFREPMQLESFRSELLPRLAEERASARRLRIWSAGCSSGEEAYTIAMLVLDSGLFAGWDVEVLGSDISRKVLGVARKGVYQRSALREAPAHMVARYFDQDGGRYQVKPEVRALVAFGRMNLLDEPMLQLVGRMDAVFCRNVMIYFDHAARRRALAGIHGRLVDGGWLLLGHSESLINLCAEFELVPLRHDLVYRKPLPPPAVPSGAR